jgi:hypothetical protein
VNRRSLAHVTLGATGIFGIGRADIASEPHIDPQTPWELYVEIYGESRVLAYHPTKASASEHLARIRDAIRTVRRRRN